MELTKTIENHGAYATCFLNSKNGRILSLDGWRAIAVLLVLLGHLGIGQISISDNPSALMQFLHKYNFAINGVILFFVLSGFLITHLILKEKEIGKFSLKAFYYRRVFRIFPAYYFYLISILIVNALFWNTIPIQVFIQSFLYLSNTNVWGYHPLLSHSWTLSIEEQFYVFWPILIMLFNKRLVLVLGVFIIIISIIAKVLLYINYPGNGTLLFFLNLFKFSDAIMVGALSAIVAHKIDIQKLWRNNFILIIVMISSMLIFVWLEYANRNMILGKITVPFTITFQSICISLWILYSITQKSVLSNFLNIKGLKFLGICSYSIYIWQQVFLIPVKNANTSIWPEHLWWFSFPPVNILLALSTGILSYYYIEKPFRKFRLT